MTTKTINVVCDCGLSACDICASNPDYFRMHLHPGYERVGPYFQVQNGNQIDIHYRAAREGEEPRELIAYSNVLPEDVAGLLAAANRS